MQLNGESLTLIPDDYRAEQMEYFNSVSLAFHQWSKGVRREDSQVVFLIGLGVVCYRAPPIFIRPSRCVSATTLPSLMSGKLLCHGPSRPHVALGVTSNSFDGAKSPIFENSQEAGFLLILSDSSWQVRIDNRQHLQYLGKYSTSHTSFYVAVFQATGWMSLLVRRTPTYKWSRFGHHPPRAHLRQHRSWQLTFCLNERKMMDLCPLDTFARRGGGDRDAPEHKTQLIIIWQNRGENTSGRRGI